MAIGGSNGRPANAPLCAPRVAQWFTNRHELIVHLVVHREHTFIWPIRCPFGCPMVAHLVEWLANRYESLIYSVVRRERTFVCPIVAHSVALLVAQQPPRYAPCSRPRVRPTL